MAGAGLSRERAQLWLAACVPVDASGGKLVVEAPNPFVEQHIRNDFLADLSRSAERAGLEGGVELRAARSGGDEEREREWTRRARDASRPEPGGVGLNPDRTFENFVVGKSNRLAHAASLAVAEMPGKAYNPLFIWGGVGLGKTHLMHAICHYALARTSGLKVMYLNAEKFINEFIQSIANKQTAQFKERYRNVDLLLMDDIQFLGGKGS
ncbi:MAG: ATP-binding protein, partial [Synergistaceae bacterium]|nr:ATP-binding protein [Synergistaceae bacterium]